MSTMFAVFTVTGGAPAAMSAIRAIATEFQLWRGPHAAQDYLRISVQIRRGQDELTVEVKSIGDATAMVRDVATFLRDIDGRERREFDDDQVAAP